jgi:hypothetical protein
MRFVPSIAVAAVALAISAPRAVADDYFLAIGGGYFPESNQVSLEKNVLLFERMLDEFYPEGVSLHAYFADGDNPNRDLQFADPDFEVPRARQLLATLFGNTSDITNQYRDHQIERLDGAASRRAIRDWFDEVGSALDADDRVFIYSTAHGGRSSDKEHPFDTSLYLWNRQSVQMHEFTEWLDDIPDEVPVVMMMVQCYSGGFSHSIFDDGRPDHGLSDANRCGFFATVETRGAAGCTPDIEEENYREYSTYFFEALRGKTRYDELVEKPDYDGDGHISFAEAHAYTVLTSTTIDIPVRTSDALLREYSRTAQEEEDSPDSQSPQEDAVATKGGEDDSEVRDDPAPPAPPEVELLSAETDYETLIAFADVIDRTIIDGLSEQLNLSGANRAQEARQGAQRVQNERNRLNRERRDLSRDFNRIREGIKRRVLNQWPEINNPWHPVTGEVLTQHADDLVKLVESHPQFGRMKELAAKIREINDQQQDHEREWVKYQRLIRTLKTVALAANLPHVADPEIVERFQHLRQAESGIFGPM